MKQRLYLDTSVFGGHFDEEYAEHTIPLFDRIRSGEFIVLFSAVTIDELEGAPVRVKDLVRQLHREQTEFLDISDEAVSLAQSYSVEGVVGRSSYADCLHIALATIHHADFLVSWNFKHIVNIDRINGYNSINVRYGYKQLDIRSPREFERYEDSR